MTIPQEHKEDAVQLTADGIVELFEISPPTGGIIRIKANNTVTWQGNVYEGTAVALDGFKRTASGETPRPKLTIANPEAVYSSLVRDGQLDNATVSRYQVLKTHIDTDQNIFQKQTWRVRLISGLTRYSITLELRELSDGQFFLLPQRIYAPPDFPLVSLA